MVRVAGRLISVFAALLLASCTRSAPEPVYAPPNYSYLRPLRLNVGSIQVQDDWMPGPEDVGALSPVPPLAALERMAHDRLIPAGDRGSALFKIEDAAIVRVGDTLNGDFIVRLDIIRPNGTPAGYAEARVTRAALLPDEDQLRPTLYLMVTQMMADMNVELEYQVKRTLARWLMTAAPPGAAVRPPVEQQPLPPPGAPALTPPPVSGLPPASGF
jgi:hypothetical protein